MTEDLIDVQHKAYEQGRKQGEQEARQQVLDEFEYILNSEVRKGNWKDRVIARMELKIGELKHKEEREE